jgi:hypothetical protein
MTSPISGLYFQLSTFNRGQKRIADFKLFRERERRERRPV